MDFFEDFFEDYVEPTAGFMVALIPLLIIPMEIVHGLLTAKCVKSHWSREGKLLKLIEL
jgi:hypothetical protein